MREVALSEVIRRITAKYGFMPMEGDGFSSILLPSMYQTDKI